MQSIFFLKILRGKRKNLTKEREGFIIVEKECDRRAREIYLRKQGLPTAKGAGGKAFRCQRALLPIKKRTRILVG